MGTWGPGNFENDCAAEYLQDLCRPMVAQIEAAAANPSSIEPDEYDSDIMMANVEILACLSEHLGRYTRGKIPDFLYPIVVPSPETIMEWKRVYLEVWDEYIDQLKPKPEYKRKRRKVIVDSFDRLERVSRTLTEGDS
jgi:hypothetical protein